MLKNDVYVNGIIDKYLFDAVQERFKEKTELDKIVQRTQGEYRGLVFCEACNRAMCYQGIDKKTYRKTAFYSCKHHTGVHPKGKPLAHMPKIGEEVLKAEVLKQFNEYILNITSDKNKLNEAVNRFGEKKNALEQDIEAVGKKILQTRELPEGRAGLWTSWKDARDGYLVSLFYRYFILCQYGMYQIQRMINKHDYLENRFIKSITVSPKGTVSVHFLGDFLFE